MSTCYDDLSMEDYFDTLSSEQKAELRSLLKEDEVHVATVVYGTYANGNLQFMQEFVDSQAQGKAMEWYNSGIKKNDRQFKDGKPDGVWTSWREDGTKEIETTYVDGHLHGDTTEYRDDGKKRHCIITYNMGDERLRTYPYEK